MTKTNDAEKEKSKTKDQKDGQATAGFNPAQFFQETKEELDKVVWPDRQRLIGESVAVVLMVALSATTIYLVDQLFSWAASLIF
uniref:Protein translocase subunit SecE n=1 Tax=Cyanothece sp. (strain PCC 7425 / ATCC 29141) TaxID=395961 RepID=B8HVL7_CYAP4